MKSKTMMVPVVMIFFVYQHLSFNSTDKPGNREMTIAIKDTIPKNKMAYSLPATITFDWEVIQEKNGDDEKGLLTYYFTSSGDYAGARMDKGDDDNNNLIIYDKGGAMLMFNESKKTITIMKLLKAVGEGAQMGKEVAEKISKKPLKRDEEDKMTITKTGKTKMICGCTADEYLMKNEGGTASIWYANVNFDPVKIYTMGADRPADINKLKNDPNMKNNMAAIPVINKNYLMAEMEAGGKKGMQTKSITKKTTTISTAGYKVIDMSNKGLKEMIQHKEN